MENKIDAFFEELKGIAVRELSSADSAAVGKLLGNSPTNLTPEQIATILASKTSCVVGAFRDDDLLGLLLANQNATASTEGSKSSAELTPPVFSQDAPAAGTLAIVLITYLFEILRQRGVERVYVLVPAKNTILAGHLSTLGFLPTGHTNLNGKSNLTMALPLQNFESALKIFPGALTLLARDQFETSLYECVRNLGELFLDITSELTRSGDEINAFDPVSKQQCPNNLTCNPGYCETQCIFPVCNIDCVASCVACVNCLSCIAPSACSSCLTSCMTNCVICVSPGAGGGCTITISKTGSPGDTATNKSIKQMEKRLNK